MPHTTATLSTLATASATAISAETTAAASSSSLAYDAWSKHVHSGQPMLIREIIEPSLAEHLPPAVRIRAQLDWFDGGASIEQCIKQAAASAATATAAASNIKERDAMEDTAESSATGADDAAGASTAASSGSGVLQLRASAHTLLVDSSLLHSASQWSTTARAVGADGESSSQLSTLQFEPGGWYEVIGEVMRSAGGSDAPPTIYVRARVCRALDDSFDAQLYEETVMLRRKMMAEK